MNLKGARTWALDGCRACAAGGCAGHRYVYGTGWEPPLSLGVTGRGMPPSETWHPNPETGTESNSQGFDVQKIGHTMMVPAAFALDAGLITADDVDIEPPARAPWWRRARFTVRWAILRARRRVGAWIAGVDPEEWRP